MSSGVLGFLIWTIGALGGGLLYRHFRLDVLREPWEPDELEFHRHRIAMMSPGEEKGWEKERLRISRSPAYGIWIERLFYIGSALGLVAIVILLAT